ncbi:hypothetical protein B0T18DRAFT_398856 [Schizothecium vesticola]|uniref:HNH nuclease domain-containing protein n=1 Tax=Schizothecium vesticola TaxID=314040 RepID=A0AA40FAJ4_9PEZI|nr:hypothetical protein B0T18DRAFT_398856 [Schizothecium vesticola]
MATWSNKPPEDVEQTGTSGLGGAEARSNADKNAQRRVPSWYGRQCSLTGVSVFDASHIVDVQAVNCIGEESLTVWRYLRMFWPLQKIEAFDIIGEELRNILPLEPTAHRLWDRNRFGLRPIPHPENPSSIYIQFVWFDHYHNTIGLGESGGESIDKDLHDTRREFVDSATQKLGCEHVAHGDVYEFRTTSPTRNPLPQLRFLQLRFAIQKLFVGVKAAGSLEHIFGGEPPEDTGGPSPDESFMPRDWAMMLEEARRLGILDERNEKLWRKSILEKARRDYLQEMARRQELMDEMGPESGEEEKQEQQEEEEEQEEKEEDEVAEVQPVRHDQN